MLYEVQYLRNKNAKKTSIKYVDYCNNVSQAMEKANVKYPITAKAVMTPCIFEEAKEAYCKGIKVFAEDGNGDFIALNDNWGSHAPIDELFYRALHGIVGYGKYPTVMYVNKLEEKKEGNA